MLSPDAAELHPLRGAEAVDLERQLLGIILCHPGLALAAEEEIGPSDFLLPEHGRLFAAIIGAESAGEKVAIEKLVAAVKGPDDAPVLPDGMTPGQYLARLMASTSPADLAEAEDLARAIARELRTAVDVEHGEAEFEAPPPDPETFRSKFGAVWFHQLERDTFEQHEWLIDDWLTVGDKSLVYGASGSGKSFLAMHAAFCVVLGIPFFGNKVLAKGGVVYQAGEGAKGIAKRVKAFRKHNGIPPSEQLPFVLLRSPVNIWSKDGDTQALIAEIKALGRMMAPAPLRMVVIDTLATATAGADENSGRDMSTVMDHVTLIAKECRCHVMLVHHKNANGERPRGHTSVFANIDNAIEVRRDPDTDIRTAVNGKQKDDADAKPIRFELMRVVVGHRREDGKEISSCVCLPVGKKVEAPATKTVEPVALRAAEAVFFKALRRAIGEHGVAPPASCRVRKGVQLVVDYTHVKAAYAALVPPEDDDPAKYRERIKKALQRGRENLTKAGIVDVDSPFIWYTGKPVKGWAQPQLPGPADSDAPPIDEASPEPEGDPVGVEVLPPDAEVEP